MKRRLFACLLLFVITSVHATNDAWAVSTEIVDRLAQAEVDRQHLVGLAVVVIDNGKIAWSKGYGYADREKQIPVDPATTAFRWASVCKPVTAIAAMQLVEKGLLDLDADVRTYVPEFPDKGVKITARQLLSHQSGIVHYANGPVIVTNTRYANLHPFADVVTALDKFKESPLVNAPGKKFSYSTHGYMLLSAVIQRAGKQKFADQLHARIAEPLGMTHFQPDYQWELIPNRAIGYSRKGDQIVARTGDGDTDVSWKAGGGGFISPATDMAAFGVGLLQHKLVSASTEREMWTIHTPKSDKAADQYGYGFYVINRPDGAQWIGHDGSQAKSRSALLLEPKTRHGIVIMSNSEWFDPMTLAMDVLKAGK